MKNRYGLDVDYAKRKLNLILRDMDNYTPSEFAREVARLSVWADESVIKKEPEFNQPRKGRG